MSRNLYTIAVVSRRIEIHLRAILGDASDISIRLAEKVVIDAVGSPHANIAFYRSLLDGWNTTHEIIGMRRAHDSDFSWCDQLAMSGHAWLTPAPDPSIDKQSNDLGDYALQAMLDAVLDARHFAKATNCSALVLHRCVGPSFDDSDFA